ncbi:MAG: AAA family ATPase [bacterium]|nr:AAA family ATPase [bacterium]
MVKNRDFRSRFGFHSTPFTREIPVKDRFALPEFDEAVDAVLRTLDDRMSCAVIAPAGTGKTSLLRAVIDRLPEARYHTHYVKVTGLSKRDMCREIACAVGASPAGTYPALVRNLQARFADDADNAGLRPVLILDEAHDLRVDTLAMMRILTNFDMDSRLVLSIVLAGQPKLRTLLRRDDLEDVARRLAHYATLRPLSREEIERYIEHRCTIAGAVKVPFDKAAVDALFEIGRGNLRATDELARKALEIAHDKDCDVGDVSHVVHARKLLWP